MLAIKGRAISAHFDSFNLIGEVNARSRVYLVKGDEREGVRDKRMERVQWDGGKTYSMFSSRKQERESLRGNKD